MKLVNIAVRGWRNNESMCSQEEITEAISEAELMERKAKAFDFITKTMGRHNDLAASFIVVPDIDLNNPNRLEAVEAAMNK